MGANDEVELELRGPLTLRHAAGLHSRILAALGPGRGLALTLDDVDEVDVSFVQILLAARLSARLAGGRLRLTKPPGKALAHVIAQGGFAGIDSLWPGGDTA